MQFGALQVHFFKVLKKISNKAAQTLNTFLRDVSKIIQHVII